MENDTQPPKTDLALRSPYDEGQAVNDSVRLYEGELLLKAESGEVAGTGTVELALQGSPHVRFRMTGAGSSINPFTGDAVLHVPPLGSSGPVLILDSTVTFSAAANTCRFTGTLTKGGMEVRQLKGNGKQEPVGRIEFHLLNFPPFRGARIARGKAGKPEAWPGRAAFSFGEWAVTLDQFQDAEERFRRARSANGNAFTHLGVLNRSNNKLFDPGDAQAALDMLFWFFSFASGARCGPVLPTGRRHKADPLWQHWSVPATAPAANNGRWFSGDAARECFSAARDFHACWRDPDRREWLELAVGLYIASNRNSHAIELALANSQIALEMLTWVALQEENSLMSEAGFEKLEAADKIRALLFWLGLPAAIPTACDELRDALPNVMDAPQAVTWIRNKVIHQTRKNRGEGRKIENGAIFQAWQLNLYYAERALLKLIGYSGPHNDRINDALVRRPGKVPPATDS